MTPDVPALAGQKKAPHERYSLGLGHQHKEKMTCQL